MPIMPMTVGQSTPDFPGANSASGSVGIDFTQFHKCDEIIASLNLHKGGWGGVAEIGFEFESKPQVPAKDLLFVLDPRLISVHDSSRRDQVATYLGGESKIWFILAIIGIED
jgi:hypothetical protein